MRADDFNLGFGSDNHSGVHPRILKAIAEANVGHAPSYGTDSISETAKQRIREHFGVQAEAHFVFNGTGANVVALASLVQSYETILTSKMSHLFVDECAAPERAIGCKVLGVECRDGKLTPGLLGPFITRRGDQHCAQVAAISISQPTEVGTVYTVSELKALAAFAREYDLWLHVDGARLVNAAASLRESLRAISTDCGVDVLSLGGTKNGLLFGEAIVFFNGTPDCFKYQRKQLLQLPSKTRFIAAQFVAWLSDNLWQEIAGHSNAMALHLRQGLAKYPFIKLTQDTQANGVFAIFPRELVAPLRERFFFYVWDERTFEVRLMTTFDTTTEQIDAFISALDQQAQRLGLPRSV